MIVFVFHYQLIRFQYRCNTKACIQIWSIPLYNASKSITQCRLHYISWGNENYRDKNSIPALMEVKILNTCLVPNSWLSWLTATGICVITEMRHFNYFQYFLGATEIIHTKYYLHLGEGNSIFVVRARSTLIFGKSK